MVAITGEDGIKIIGNDPNDIGLMPEVDDEFSQKALESCPHCSRTFLPKPLAIHLKSCKEDRPLKKRIARSSQPNQMGSRSRANKENAKKENI